MSLPLFPKCLPKMTDRAWFDVDHPCDHEDEVSQLEKEHQDWVNKVDAITRTNSDLTPIGKTSSEIVGDDDEEEEDDNDDDDDDDDSESHDEDEDEIEMEAAN